MWLWKNPGLPLVQEKKKEHPPPQGTDDTTTGILWIVLASHIKETWTHLRNRCKEILLITRKWNAYIQEKELILPCLNCKVKASWGLGLLSSNSREWGREILVAKMKRWVASQANEEVLSVNQLRPEIWGFETRSVRKYRSREWEC